MCAFSRIVHNEATCETNESVVNLFFKMLRWVLGREVSARESWVSGGLAPRAPLLRRIPRGGSCPSISFPSARVEVAFHDFTHWALLAFDLVISRLVTPYSFSLALCQAVFRRISRDCQRKITSTSFICQNPVIAAGVSQLDSGYEVRLWFYCHFLFFWQSESTRPPLHCARVCCLHIVT